jgi:competence protein ComEA
VTREERNVLLFVALGVLLGSLPGIVGEKEPRVADREPVAAAAVVAVDLFPIDVNRAGPELLEELPGIGPAKARAIVQLREERGPFRRVEELADVHGIGMRTVETLRDLVTLGGSAGAGPVEPEANAAPRGRLDAGTSRDSAPGERADHRGSAR